MAIAPATPVLAGNQSKIEICSESSATTQLFLINNLLYVKSSNDNGIGIPTFALPGFLAGVGVGFFTEKACKDSKNRLAWSIATGTVVAVPIIIKSYIWVINKINRINKSRVGTRLAEAERLVTSLGLNIVMNAEAATTDETEYLHELLTALKDFRPKATSDEKISLDSILKNYDFYSRKKANQGGFQNSIANQSKVAE